MNDNILNIYEREYKDVLYKHKEGNLVLYIDTASFREFFTDCNCKQIQNIIGVSISRQANTIRTIFYLLPIFLLSLGITTIIGFKWWSFLFVPIFYFTWIAIHSGASIGIQRINGPILLLLSTILFSYIYLDKYGLYVQISFILWAMVIFMSKYMYYLSSKYAFELLLTNYKFFGMFYETKYKANSLTSMVWTDSKENYNKMTSS